MVAGMTGEPQTGDIHLNAMTCERTLVALWGAGYGDRLRGLGDRFQVVFDRDGVRLARVRMLPRSDSNGR